MKRMISLMMIAAFVAAFVVTVPFGMAAKADEHCSGEETLNAIRQTILPITERSETHD